MAESAAAELVQPLNIGNYATRKAVAGGTGQFPRLAATQTVEA